MDKFKVTERGWPGHFIGSKNCLFWRNTLVEYEDTKVVVSTIGRYMPEDRDEVEPIGAGGRYFETQAWHSKEDKFDDIALDEDVHLNGKWQVKDAEPEADLRANDMHEDRVEEIKERLQSGDIR